MVQLVEVEDEHFTQPQPGPEEDDDEYTDTGTSRLAQPIFCPPYLSPVRHLSG
jgi:hypothetical protein